MTIDVESSNRLAALERIYKERSTLYQSMCKHMQSGSRLMTEYKEELDALAVAMDVERKSK